MSSFLIKHPARLRRRLLVAFLLLNLGIWSLTPLVLFFL